MLIIQLLDNVDEDDLSFLSDEFALGYVKKIQTTPTCSATLKHVFAHSDPELFKILKGLLAFNPHLRLTAKQALKSKLFDDIRSPEYERPSSIKIHQKINDVGVFDYDNFVKNKYKIQDYKKMLIREIKAIKKLNLLSSEGK